MPKIHRIVSAASVAAVSVIAGAQPPAALDQELAAFVNQYIVHSGIEYHADVTVRLFAEFGEEHADDGTPIAGAFSAWARDDRYARRIHLDPQGYPGLDKSIAFNGVTAQSIEHDRELAVVKTGDVPTFGMDLPDPLAELVQFLYPLSDASPLEMPRFVGPVSDPNLLVRLGTVTWIAWDDNSATALFPGALLDGIAYEHRVLFERSNGVMLPTSIERRAPGMTLTSLSLSNPQPFPAPGGTMLWPTDAVYRAHAPDSSVLGEYHYNITTIDASGLFSDDVFTLPSTRGERIWDADAHEFLP